MTLQKLPDPFLYDRPEAEEWIDFMNRHRIDVMEGSYGAHGDDTGDDAPAIQAAINDMPARGGVVYLPPGIYHVTSNIVFPTDRQVRLMGAGPEATKLHVSSGTTATPGIIHLRGAELRSSVEQLQIYFDQPDVSNRASLTHYVPAIYAQGLPRFRVQHVRIVRAWDGIDLRQNANCEINDLEISHFNTGIQIDGSQDMIRITELHDWVFGCTGNQMQAVFNELNVGIRLGRADGVTIANCMFFCGTGIHTFPSETTIGACFAYITNCLFDSFSGLKMDAGNIRIGDSGFTTQSGAGYQCIRATATNAASIAGHSLQVNNCLFFTNTYTPIEDALVELGGQSGAGYLEASFTGCLFHTAHGNMASIRADATAGGIIHIHVENNQFVRNGNVAYTKPTLDFGQNVRMSVVNNITRDKGTGAGDFLSAATTAGVVDGNVLLGWGLNFWAGAQPIGGNNLGAAITGPGRELAPVAGYVQAAGIANLDAGAPPFALLRYTGTLDGSGNASVTHGLGVLPQTGLAVQAWYKSGAGAMIPLTVGGIDNTQINVAGGVASAPYRVVVMYSSSAHVW